MSAPRKIWVDKASMSWVEAYPGQHMNPCEEVYHHNDVVRDLFRIARQALDEWESCIDSEYSGTSSYGEMIADVHEKRAALAKIAQEE